MCAVSDSGVGAVPSPFDCYLALRGLKTLGVRMERHASNALALAKYLEAHEYVEKVLYPGEWLCVFVAGTMCFCCAHQ